MSILTLGIRTEPYEGEALIKYAYLTNEAIGIDTKVNELVTFMHFPFAISQKWGNIETHLPVCLSVPMSVCHKNFGMYDPFDKPFQFAPCRDLDF